MIIINTAGRKILAVFYYVTINTFDIPPPSKKKYPVNNRHKAREMMTISEWFAIIFLSY